MEIHLDVGLGCEEHCIRLIPYSWKHCFPKHTRKTSLDKPKISIKFHKIKLWAFFLIKNTFSSTFFNERSLGMKILGFGMCKSSMGAIFTHFCTNYVTNVYNSKYIKLENMIGTVTSKCTPVWWKEWLLQLNMMYHTKALLSLSALQTFLIPRIFWRRWRR